MSVTIYSTYIHVYNHTHKHTQNGHIRVRENNSATPGHEASITTIAVYGEYKIKASWLTSYKLTTAQQEMLD